MGKTVIRTRERLELRTAKIERPCFGWLEKLGDRVYGVKCTRIIGVGERYLVSTVFPGHYSGLADAWSESHPQYNPETKTFDRVIWVEHKAAPISHAFCLPCAHDWLNLRNALEEMGELNQELIA